MNFDKKYILFIPVRTWQRVT